MKKTIYILILLILLTGLSALAANGILGDNVKPIILLASWIKFLLIGFYFMELIKAHAVWKIIFVTFSTVFFGLSFII